MNRIEDALKKFLKYDYVIERDSNDSSISGYDKIAFITVTAPCVKTNNYWVVRIYPRVLVDEGVASQCFERYCWTCEDIIECLESSRSNILDWLLYFLSKEYKELQLASEVLK